MIHRICNGLLTSGIVSNSNEKRFTKSMDIILNGSIVFIILSNDWLVINFHTFLLHILLLLPYIHFWVQFALLLEIVLLHWDPER